MISDRRKEELTGVVASMRRLTEANAASFEWLLPEELSSRAVEDVEITLINGGFPLDDIRALRWLEHRIACRARHVYLYWHETGVSLRRLAGIGDCYARDRHRRQRSWSRICDVARHPRVTHLAASQAVQGALVKAFEIPWSRTRVIYECAPVPSSTPRSLAPGVLRICSVGTSDPRKRRDLFDRLALENPALAGRPTIWSWYGERLDSRGVTCRGFVPNLTESLRIHDVYVSTAADEPFSVAGVEALAAGLPVLCLDRTGLAEVVPPTWVAEHADALPESIARVVDAYTDNARTALAIAHRLALPMFRARFLRAVGWTDQQADIDQRP